MTDASCASQMSRALNLVLRTTRHALTLTANPRSQSSSISGRSNALATADEVLSTVKRLSESFPEGLAYDVIYNPTTFIPASIDAVVGTMIEAVLLVVLVVILFLGTWRAALVPILAIPVSLVGTFAVMAAVGYWPAGKPTVSSPSRNTVPRMPMVVPGPDHLILIDAGFFWSFRHRIAAPEDLLRRGRDGKQTARLGVTGELRR